VIFIENTKTVSVTPEYIKKTLRFDDSDVLHINVKFPDIKILPIDGHNKKNAKKINDFYHSAVKIFMRFCEKNLYKNAAVEFMTHKNNNGDDNNIQFKPFGAVITFEVTENQQDLLQIYLDINIFAGKGQVISIRKSHVWQFNGAEVFLKNR